MVQHDRNVRFDIQSPCDLSLEIASLMPRNAAAREEENQ
jgi:hypothetical protein